MAISAASIWEVRTTGNDSNSGGFVAGASGTDWSQQDSSHVAFNGTTTFGATVGISSNVVLTGYSVVASDVGNLLLIDGGANFTTGFYQITAVTTGSNTGTWTLDRNCATGVGAAMTGAMGGALVSPSIAAGNKVAGNTVYIKTGTYTSVSATANVAGGVVLDSTGGTVVTWEGYQTTRGDLGTPPVLKAGSISTFSLFKTSGGTVGSLIRNIIVDGNLQTASKGFDLAARTTLYLCVGRNCTNNAFNTSSAGSQLIKCIATGCTTQAAFNAGLATAYFMCEAFTNTATGFGDTSSGVTLTHCISYNNSGASSDGFSETAIGRLENCTAYNNGRHGFAFNAAEAIMLINCIAEANGSFGYAGIGANRPAISRINCATALNTAGTSTLLNGMDLNPIVGSVSFFIAPGSNNFALNANTGGGVLVRAAGIPGAYVNATTTGFTDIGAVQHKDTPPVFLVD